VRETGVDLAQSGFEPQPGVLVGGLAVQSGEQLVGCLAQPLGARLWSARQFLGGMHKTGVPRSGEQVRERLSGQYLSVCSRSDERQHPEVRLSREGPAVQRRGSSDQPLGTDRPPVAQGDARTPEPPDRPYRVSGG
jgi:hypothetical protein